jgi:hypothetical protein
MIGRCPVCRPMVRIPPRNVFTPRMMMTGAVIIGIMAAGRIGGPCHAAQCFVAHSSPITLFTL